MRRTRGKNAVVGGAGVEVSWRRVCALWSMIDGAKCISPCHFEFPICVLVIDATEETTINFQHFRLQMNLPTKNNSLSAT
jgi:hypothetical protein